MTDDLRDFKALMNDATPRPDAQRRQENLSLAHSNFARLHAPDTVTAPESLWSRGKAWFGGTAASLAVVATAVVLFVPTSTPIQTAPVAADLEDVVQSTADFAKATENAPQALSRAAAPAMMADESTIAVPEAMATPTNAPLNFAQIGGLVKAGDLPIPADVEVSAMLAGVADELLAGTDRGTITSLPTPWDAASYLVFVMTPLGTEAEELPLDQTWILLGETQSLAGKIEVYLADTFAGEAATNQTEFAAAVIGFALLLKQDPSVSNWSVDQAIALARRGVSDGRSRTDMIALMEQTRALTR